MNIAVEDPGSMRIDVGAHDNAMEIRRRRRIAHCITRGSCPGTMCCGVGACARRASKFSSSLPTWNAVVNGRPLSMFS